jgi:hypothetical protein
MPICSASMLRLFEKFFEFIPDDHKRIVERFGVFLFDEKVDELCLYGLRHKTLNIIVCKICLWNIYLPCKAATSPKHSISWE